MNITYISLIIAIIGCVTGLSGFLIQFYNWSLMRPKITMAIDKSHNSYFFNAYDFGVSGFQTEISAAVSLRITNASSYPVTIHGAYLKKDSKIMKHNQKFVFTPHSFNISNNSPDDIEVFTRYEPSSALQIPVRIDSFDTIYFSLRIPFAEDLLEPDPTNKKVNVIVVLQTPRKDVKMKVSLLEYNNYHKEQRH